MKTVSNPVRHGRKYAGGSTAMLIGGLACAAIVWGLAFGTYYTYTADAAALNRFETARRVALAASDPFLQLGTFRSAIGDYGASCFVWDKTPCIRRADAEKELVRAGAAKGSVPALLFLFDTSVRTPGIYFYDLPASESGRLRQRLIDLADTAPVTKASAEIFSEAAQVLRYGTYTQQTHAARLYVKAWQAGAPWAASQLADLYQTGLKDNARAYFWHVRAGNVPVNTPEVNSLSGEQKMRLERLATDNSLTDI